MMRFIHLAAAAAAGMAAMYYFDPAHGERRRSVLCAWACCRCDGGGQAGNAARPTGDDDLTGPGGGVGTAP